MSIKKMTALLLAGVLCLSALTGCGAKPEDTVATLGEETITYELANFLCKYQKSTIDDMYAMYGMTWDTDLYGNGVTMEKDFKDSAMELLHDLYTLKAHMADYDVELTAEDEAAVEAAAKAFMEANSAEAIEEFGASQEVVEELLTLYTIQAKMYKAIIVDTDREVSDEEANMRGYSMVMINLDGKYNESYQYVEYTDAEVAVLKETANHMADLLETKSFEDAAKEAGLEISTGAYEKDDTTIEKDVLVAMDALKEGEVSKMIETESAIYFVRIDKDTDAEATEANRNSIIAERETALFELVVTDWQKEDGWKVNQSVVDSIEFHNMFTQNEQSTAEVDTTEGE